MTKPANPPAFPRPYSVDGQHREDVPKNAQDGMSLRDYFAAQAMQGMVASIDSEENYLRLRAHGEQAGCKNVSSWIARDAYKQADAMLKAREVK